MPRTTHAGTVKRRRTESWRETVHVRTDVPWFEKHVADYNADEDGQLGSILLGLADLTSCLPDHVYRPDRYRCLTVLVPDSEFVPEWESRFARSIYPDLPNGDRHDRCEYQKALDRHAFCMETDMVHSPPDVHV